jgi:hypothetical protein
MDAGHRTSWNEAGAAAAHPARTAQREGESKSDNSEYGPAAYVALPGACWLAYYRTLQAHGAKGCHRQARQLEIGAASS